MSKIQRKNWKSSPKQVFVTTKGNSVLEMQEDELDDTIIGKLGDFSMSDGINATRQQ